MLKTEEGSSSLSAHSKRPKSKHMEIDIKIQYKDNTIQNKKILTDEQINDCGVGNILQYTLSEMKDDVIKKFLDRFTEYSMQSDAEK